MKGLLVSLAAFVLYGMSFIIVTQILRPKRHLMLMAKTGLAWCAGYLILYQITPADLWFLPAGWICSVRWLDRLYGLAILVMNVHSSVCALYGGCGGFSVSMLVAILQRRGQGATTAELVAQFKLPDGTDQIYGSRVPQLIESGYIRTLPETGNSVLTAKGRRVALLARTLKRLMNLREGG